MIIGHYFNPEPECRHEFRHAERAPRYRLVCDECGAECYSSGGYHEQSILHTVPLDGLVMPLEQAAGEEGTTTEHN